MNVATLTLLSPVLTLILFEVFLYYNRFIYAAIVIVFVVFAYTSYHLTKESAKEEKWYDFFLQPAIFSLSSAAFATMLTDWYVIQFLFAMTALFINLYFRHAYYFLLKPGSYKEYALENFSSYGNFLAVFFFSSAFFGLQSFFNIRITYLLPLLIILLALVFYQVIWANNLELKSSLIFIAIGCLILTELAWSFSFLSLNYLVVGLVFALCYYIYIGISRFYLKSNLTNKIIRMYLIFGLISIITILLTARWV